jgi:hypothetical protein
VGLYNPFRCGIDAAMGVKRDPAVAGVLQGITGGSAFLFMEWWANA